MIVLILSILGSVFSLGGNILIAHKKRSGWWIWILGNIAWLGVNFLGTMNIPMVVMYVFYLITNIAGYIEWGKKSDLHKAIDECNEKLKNKPKFDFSDVKAKR